MFLVSKINVAEARVPVFWIHHAVFCICAITVHDEYDRVIMSAN